MMSRMRFQEVFETRTSWVYASNVKRHSAAERTSESRVNVCRVNVKL